MLLPILYKKIASARVSSLSGWSGFLSVCFILLFTLLFFGDGSTSYVDAAGAAATVIIVWFGKMRFEQHREFPFKTLAAFTALGFVIGFGVIRSIDPGASLRLLVRYADAFLLYYVFYTRAPKNSLPVHALFLCLFGVVAGLISVIGSPFPYWREVLPLMNLLFLSAGHNHVSDILLLSLLPFLVFVRTYPRVFRYAAFMLYMFLFVFSQARAALVVAVLTTGVFLNSSLGRFFGTRGKALLTLFITGTLLFGVFVPEILPKNVSNINKTRLSGDRRTEYWTQAVRAIKQRPLFGSGAGTFYLLSDTYESAPGNSSWFAHNFILETWAESGVVGVLIVGWVFWEVYVRFLFQRRAVSSKEETVLSFAPIPILAYSLIDFSLSYLVVWMALWMYLGAVAAYEQ